MKHARTIQELIVNAGGHSDLHIIPKAGHMVIECQAADIAERIAEFLGRQRE